MNRNYGTLDAVLALLFLIFAVVLAGVTMVGLAVALWRMVA